MTRLDLDVHGAAAAVSGDSRAVEALRGDFEYFASRAPAASPALRLELQARAPGAEDARGAPLFLARDYVLAARDGARVVRYRDGAVAVDDRAAGTIRVACADPARLHELGYLAALSRLGEALDRAGAHRVHALGFAWRGQGGLLLLPSGGGKSTLALRLLPDPRFELLSDDSPLLDARARLRAFPLRMALRPDADLAAVPEALRRPFRRLRHGPKVAVGLGFFRARVRPEAPLRWLLVGRRGPGPAGPGPASPARAAAALGANMVVGLGLAQMSEYMLRASPAGLAELAGIAAGRARAASAALRAAESREFRLGEDPSAAAAALARFLDA